MQAADDLSLVYSTEGYEAGRAGDYAVYENQHGDLYVETHTGFADYPAHLAPLEVQHITMTSF